VGGEERGDKSDGLQTSEFLDGLEHFEFASSIETIAGFDLGGGGAMAKHGLKAREGLLHKIRDRSGADLTSSADNSTAGGEDIEIGCSLETHFEVSQTVARIDDMSVRVDKTGKEGFAGGVDRGGCGEVGE